MQVKRDRRAADSVYSAAYRITHRAEKAAYQATYRAAHRDEAAASRDAHRDELRAYSRAYSAAYYAAHPERYAHYVNTRRARKAGNGGAHTLAEWLALVAQYAGCCAYCGEAKPLTRDHVIPLIRGGTDFIENIVPACRPCNSRKGTKRVGEMAA